MAGSHFKKPPDFLKWHGVLQPSRHRHIGPEAQLREAQLARQHLATGQAAQSHAQCRLRLLGRGGGGEGGGGGVVDFLTLSRTYGGWLRNPESRHEMKPWWKP